MVFYVDRHGYPPIRWDKPKRLHNINKSVVISLMKFKKKPKFGTKFWKKKILGSKKVPPKMW